MRPILCFATLLVLLSSSSSSPAGDAKLPLLFADDFEKDADRWQPTDAKAWKLVQTKEGRHYSQFQNSKYTPPHRSPLNIDLIKDLRVTDFDFEAKVKSNGKDGPQRDMCLFFGYRDAATFYSMTLAKKDATTAQ